MGGWLLLVVLTAQPAVVGAPETNIAATEAIKINILIKQPAPQCAAQTNDEIIVCAEKTDNESQRLRPIANANLYGKDESNAEFEISENARMAVETDSAELGGGVSSKRLMARLKIKF